VKLTKKQTKRYKALITEKLDEMNIKNEIGYTKTGSFREVVVPYHARKEGEPQIQTLPNYRAANLRKNLTKKLLKMSPEAIDRFLDTIIPSEDKETEVMENE